MNKPYRWLMQQSKPAHRWLFIAITVSVLSGILMILQAGILAFVIDRVYLHHATRHMLSMSLIALGILIVLRTGLSFAREISAFHTATLVKTRVRKTLTQTLMQLSPLELARHKTGALTATLIEQVEALHGFFADYLPQMTITIILPLIILVIVFLQNWLAGLILLFTAPLIPLFMALIGIGTAELNQQNFQTLSRMSGHFLDLLQGLTTLKLFDRANAQIDSIEKISNQFREKTMRILRVAFLSSSTLELFSTIAIAIIAVYLGLGLLGFVHSGFNGVHITLAHALFILLLAPEFYLPLRQLGAFYHARSEAIGAATELMKILDDQAPQKHTSPIKTIENNIVIQCENITYAYHPTKKIIDNLTISFTPNTMTVITGESGKGKTTLLNLIAKLLTPNAGIIKINNTSLAEIADDSWREKIAFLHQHPRLFYGSIADNIRFAKPSATDDEVLHAAQLSGVMDFANSLPEKLDTKIGEQYRGLSGGQAQRVALARLVLKDASIVLLDEPTSHLDDSNAKIALNLLKTWKHKKTVIVATHDERVIQMGDCVVASLFEIPYPLSGIAET